MSATAYPLAWPPARPRTAPGLRNRAKFHSTRWIESTTGGSGYKRGGYARTMADARQALAVEMDRLGARSVVLSTNVELRADGQPYSNRRDPEDPGAALYFVLGKRQLAMACDRWDRVADNVYALALCIGAIRGLDRWGASEMVEAAFSGFKALPERGSGTSWKETLGLTDVSAPTVDQVRAAYRQRATETHPDREGGSAAAFYAVQEAFRQGMDATR